MPPVERAERTKTVAKSEESWKIAQAEFKRLARYLDREGENADPANINERYLRCREYCDKIVFQDFQCAIEHDVEAKLWDVHVSINAWFRKRLEKLKEGKAKEKKHVESRKVSKRFLEFIKSAQHYYRSFIQRLGSNFGGIPELRAVALKLHVETSLVENPEDTVTEMREAILLSCSTNVSRLGDLSRWREEKRGSGEPEWAHAVGFYDLASYLRPQSGRPHHQRAVIARASKDGNLKVLYWFFRALVCLEPYPAALNNLELFYEKILNPSKHKQRANTDATDAAMNAGELVNGFVLLHAKLHDDFMHQEIEELEKKFISSLTLSSNGSMSANTYKKIALINLAAEALASMQAEGESRTRPLESDAVDLDPATPYTSKLYSRRLRLLSLNAKTFSALLAAIQPGIKELMREAESIDGDRKRLSDKISTTLRRVLPSLRLYSSWLVYSLPVLDNTFGDNSFFETTKVSIQILWQTFADTWTLLVNVFSLRELTKLPTIDYLLEEDEETLGFLPFQESSGTIHRFHDLRTKLRKPGPNTDGIERHHPNLEMLGRVRDIVADGGRIAEDDTTPISLVNDEESGLSIIFDGSLPSLPSTPLRSHVPGCFSSNTTHVTGNSHGSSDSGSGSGSVSGSGNHNGNHSFEPDETEYPGASDFNEIVNKLVGEDDMLVDHDLGFRIWGQPQASGMRTPPSHTFESPLDIDPFCGKE